MTYLHFTEAKRLPETQELLSSLFFYCSCDWGGRCFRMLTHRISLVRKGSNLIEGVTLSQGPRDTKYPLKTCWNSLKIHHINCDKITLKLYHVNQERSANQKGTFRGADCNTDKWGTTVILILGIQDHGYVLQSHNKLTLEMHILCGAEYFHTLARVTPSHALCGFEGGGMRQNPAIPFRQPHGTDRYLSPMALTTIL